MGLASQSAEIFYDRDLCYLDFTYFRFKARYDLLFLTQTGLRELLSQDKFDIFQNEFSITGFSLLRACSSFDCLL